MLQMFRTKLIYCGISVNDKLEYDVSQLLKYDVDHPVNCAQKSELPISIPHFYEPFCPHYTYQYAKMLDHNQYDMQ